MNNNKNRHTDIRLEWLDAIRGISCLAVVLYHYTFRFDQLYGHDFQVPHIIHLGALGVLSFFIVSGFVISLSLERCSSVSDFIFNRFSRLYPSYWVAITLTYVVVSVFGLPGREVSFGDFLVNFTMFQELLNVPHVDGAYWTLSVELIFYFWITLVWRAKLLKNSSELLIALSAISIAISHISGIPHVKIASRLLLLDYGTFFLSGAVFYHLWKREGTPKKKYLALIFGCVTPYFQGRGLDQLVIIAIIYLAFLSVSKGLNARIRAPRILVYLGGLTYTLYLVHQNLGYVLIREVKPYIGSIPAVALATFSAISISIALRRFVEEPALRHLRQWKSERQQLVSD